jgi:hypothetical protein
MKSIVGILVLAFLAAGLAACGGGSSSAANSTAAPTPPAQVQGVAMPKSVSVVTAN